MASILKVFDIVYPVDKDGIPYVPKTEYILGVIRCANSFIWIIYLNTDHAA